MTASEKALCAGVLYAIWGLLVLMGKASSDGYVYAISTGLTALGVNHISKRDGE